MKLRARSPLDLKFMEVKFLKLDSDLPQKHIIKGKGETLERLPPYHKLSQSHDFVGEEMGEQSLEMEIDSLTQAISLRQEQLQKCEGKRKRLQRTRQNSHTEFGNENQLPTKQSAVKNKISALRSQTGIIHQQIRQLYQNELIAEQDSIKKIRKVKRLPEQQPLSDNRASSQPRRDITSFYQNLRKSPNSDQQYLNRIADLKAKLQASAIPKRFEQYLVSHNLRVPMFLKELHSNSPAKN